VPEELPSRHVVLRRKFRVPSAWREGTVELWQKAWFSWTVAGRARYWLDGREVTQGDGRDGLTGITGLEAGSEHTLVIDVQGEGDVCGIRGNTWLAFTREPKRKMPLDGAWVASPDYLTPGRDVSLPGVADAKLLTRSFDLPADFAGSQVYVKMTAGRGITGLLVNGRYVRRHHHALGDTTFLNLTPWLKPGTSNRLDLLTGGGRCDIREVSLWVY
jgi:hypothetical protein